MPELDFNALQWLLAFAAALMVGVSKTGMPGAGILVAPMIAMFFPEGRLAQGALLPMLLFADFFAVGWFRRHADWKHLLALAPWLAPGILIGALLLHVIGLSDSQQDLAAKSIAVIVLCMIALYLLRKWLGDRLLPTSKPGQALTGVAAGFATTVGNAAGPVTGVYLAAAKLPKEAFIGTSAWLYLALNGVKVPVYAYLTYEAPKHPMFTASSLAFDAMVLPGIVAGAFLGRVLLRVVPQQWFEAIVLVLAGIASLKLLLG